jgi:hypothetical protein
METVSAQPANGVIVKVYVLPLVVKGYKKVKMLFVFSKRHSLLLK